MNVTLNNGVEMPQVGYGVFQVPPDETEKAVLNALEAGYRSIDTAAGYRNEKSVGRALASSDVPREDVFVTTKLWNSEHGRDKTLAAFDVSVSKLGVEVLDLYLMHWPLPGQDLYVETWKAFEELYRDGRVRAIGVSNFNPDHLDRLAAECTVVPAVNQVEVHPLFPQAPLRAYHQAHQIHTEAWSPIGQGGELLDSPVLAGIAKAHDVDAAQVVLRWHVQKGNIIIPKSVTPSRIASNLDVFGFELSTDEMAAVDGLDSGTRLGPDPADFEFVG